MKTYHGHRRGHDATGEGTFRGECEVVREHHGKWDKLNPRNDIRDHSPDGFEWGYCGSGPAQLSLAIIADVYGDKFAVPRVYQQFKREVVSKLDYDGWMLTESQIRDFMDRVTLEYITYLTALEDE